jgi:hypothetical protein
MEASGTALRSVFVTLCLVLNQGKGKVAKLIITTATLALLLSLIPTAEAPDIKHPQCPHLPYFPPLHLHLPQNLKLKSCPQRKRCFDSFSSSENQKSFNSYHYKSERTLLRIVPSLL